MSSTKFIISLIGVIGLIISSWAGKFTGELGLYISAIIGAYVTGNTLITKASLQNGNGHGKEPT